MGYLDSHVEAHIHNVFSFKVCDGLIIGCFVIQKTLEKLELLHPRLYKTIVVPLVYFRLGLIFFQPFVLNIFIQPINNQCKIQNSLEFPTETISNPII